MLLRPSRRLLLGTAAAGVASFAMPRIGRAQKDHVRAAFVYVGPIGDHGWTYRHDVGRQDLEDALGDKVSTTYVENVAEGPDAERVIRQLAADGNDIIFTTSFGFMNPTVRVAQQFPDVMFEHCTGYQTAPNLAVYNARFHEGRAVIGTIAGHVSESGIVGYIGSFPIPEVVMGINAFQLAARKVNPDMEVRVIWVNSWYDPGREAEAASTLADQGADIISQHTDSPAALQVAEERGIHAFGQASDMSAFAPTAQLTAIVDNWSPHYIARCQALLDGTWETQNVWHGLIDGEVEIAPYNESLSPDVVAAAEAVRDGIIAGTLDPFAGPITDNSGELRVPEGEALDDAALLSMDWYVEGVQA